MSRWSQRRGLWAATLFIAALALSALVLDHRSHVLGVLPYVLLLACPLMLCGTSGVTVARTSSSAIGGQPVVQPIELYDVLVGQQVPPEREHVPELEEDHPAFLQRFPHLCRRRPAPLAVQDPDEPVPGKGPEEIRETWAKWSAVATTPAEALMPPKLARQT